MEPGQLTPRPTVQMSQINAVTRPALDLGHLQSLLEDSCPINVATFVPNASSFCKAAKS